MDSGFFERTRIFFGFRRMVVGFLALILTAGAALADPPYPWYGVRVVDGDFSDWNLPKDYFAQMYRAGSEVKAIESWLYLRYDCTSSTLFILVRGRPSVPVFAIAEEAWVAVDGNWEKLVDGDAGNDGVPPEFEWIDLNEEGTFAAGYEASIILPPGSYTLIVHADVYDDLEGQTSATADFPKGGVDVILDCVVPVEEFTWAKVKSLYR